MGMSKLQYEAGNYLAVLHSGNPDATPAVDSLENIRGLLLKVRDCGELTEVDRARIISFAQGVLIGHPEYFAPGGADAVCFKSYIHQTFIAWAWPLGDGNIKEATFHA